MQRHIIAVTLWDAYLVQALPGMSPSIGLGNRSKSHITALTVGLFLALVRLHLATETGFLCGAESRVSLGSEVMALKTVPVSWSQASSKSHLNLGQKPPSHTQRDEASRSKTLGISAWHRAAVPDSHWRAVKQWDISILLKPHREEQVFKNSNSLHFLGPGRTFL